MKTKRFVRTPFAVLIMLTFQTNAMEGANKFLI